jgi:hypothetical protein
MTIMPGTQRKNAVKAEDEEPKVGPIKPEPDQPDEEQPKGKHSLLNPGTTAVTYDHAGRQVDPGSTVDVDELDDVAQTAIERGYLIEK